MEGEHHVLIIIIHRAAVCILIQPAANVAVDRGKIEQPMASLPVRLEKGSVSIGFLFPV